MKVSYNWLKDYLDFELSPEEVGRILTDTGLEVEGLVRSGAPEGNLEGIVVGEVLTKEKHPDADRLSLTTVNVGSGEPLQIVCGAPNVEAGQKVPVALVGTTLHPSPEESFTIKKSKIRGQESVGMICAEDEMGVGTSHDGIMVLDPSLTPGTPMSDVLTFENDTMIEIGLTPNRNDGMSHIGVARDLKAYLNIHENKNLSIKWPEAKELEVSEGDLKITVEDKAGCPRYAGAVISDVQVAESPEWLQIKLKSIGLSPINNIVDITNFVMHEAGNPLHAFDLNVVGSDIVVRTAKSGEKLTTLDETERELHSEDLMICNTSDPMCIAGAFGGLTSGVSDSTTSIFLEAAYFNPVSVRKAAKRHVLNTDSSFRFERGVDPNQVFWSMERAASLICEIAGGSVSAVYDDYPEAISSEKIELRFDRCRMLTGTDISNQEIIRILEELDFGIESKSESSAVLIVPTYRADVLREADVIEEVLRIYGFNKVELPEQLRSSISVRKKPDPEAIYNIVAELMVSNGYTEIMNNSLSSSNQFEGLQTNQLNAEYNVTILNPLSNELDVMRQSMLFGGLRTVEYNQNRQHPDLKLYEFGSVYSLDGNGYKESRRLGIWITGKSDSENWSASTDKVDEFELKSTVLSIFDRIGVTKKRKTKDLQNDLFSSGLEVHSDGKLIAEFGQINKTIQKKFDIKNAVFYADIRWDTVLELAAANKITVNPIPKTQFARRDFSLLINETVKFNDIRKIAFDVDQKLLRKVGLFDVFEKSDKLEKGKKSYAVSFIFQDDENTLKDDQLDSVMDKIRKRLENDLSAELR